MDANDINSSQRFSSSLLKQYCCRNKGLVFKIQLKKKNESSTCNGKGTEESEMLGDGCGRQS